MAEGITDELLETHLPRLRRYARALTRNVQAADDLVQDCLERAWRNAHRWEAGTDLRAWLFTVMHNLFISQMRAAQRRAPLRHTEDIDSVADTFTHCFAAPVRDAQGVSIATLCIVAPRADASKNYHDYRRVLIDSANSLARRINE